MLVRSLVNRCVSSIPNPKLNHKLSLDIFKEKPWLNPFDDIVRVGSTSDHKKKIKIEDKKSIDDYETHKSIQHMMNVYSG